MTNQQKGIAAVAAAIAAFVGSFVDWAQIELIPVGAAWFDNGGIGDGIFAAAIAFVSLLLVTYHVFAERPSNASKALGVLSGVALVGLSVYKVYDLYARSDDDNLLIEITLGLPIIIVCGILISTLLLSMNEDNQ